MSRWEQGKLHLELLGAQREIAFPYALGEATALDIIPTARALSEGITAVSVEHTLAEGFSITCGPGCGACCRQLVPIAPLEASALSALVAALPEPRQSELRARFALAVERLEQVGLLDVASARGRGALLREAESDEGDWQNVSRRYYALGIACPFLEHESCSIYAQRPLICREYQVVTPASYCQTLDARTQAIPWYVRMSEVLADLGGTLTQASSASIPFVLALEFAEVHGAAFLASVDGETLAQCLLDKIAAHSEQPAPLR